MFGLGGLGACRRVEGKVSSTGAVDMRSVVLS